MIVVPFTASGNDHAHHDRIHLLIIAIIGVGVALAGVIIPASTRSVCNLCEGGAPGKPAVIG